jgi:hypothetical protein
MLPYSCGIVSVYDIIIISAANIVNWFYFKGASCLQHFKKMIINYFKSNQEKKDGAVGK